MVFTNIEKLVSAGTRDTVSDIVKETDVAVSQVELENPLVKYQIETRCDLFYLYRMSDKSPHGFLNEKNLSKYYPDQWQEIQERTKIMQTERILNKDVPMEFWGLHASIILEEYMINPKLKADVTHIVYDGGGWWDLERILEKEDPACLERIDTINETIDKLRTEYKGHRDSDGNFVDSVEVQEYMKSVIPKFTQVHETENSS